MNNKGVKSILLASAAVLSWSTVATAFKIALRTMSVYEMVLVSCITATLFFTIWLGFTGGLRELRSLSPKVWLSFAIVGLVMPTSYYPVLFAAYSDIPAQIAQPVNYIWPILLTLMLALFGGRKLKGIELIGMLISLSGVVCISTAGGFGESAISGKGIFLALLSAFLWAVYWIVNDRVRNSASESVSLFLTFLFGSVYMLLALPFMPTPALGLDALAAGAYIGIFEMAFPFVCFGLAIRIAVNPTVINQMCYLAPFLSLFFISTILGEAILPTTFIGLALIVAGLIFNAFIERREERQKKLCDSAND